MRKKSKLTFEEIVAKLKSFYRHEASYNVVTNDTTFSVKEVKVKGTQMPLWFKMWSENVYSKDISNINRRLDTIEKDVAILKEDVAAIKECPTIKKELKLAINKK